MGRCATGIFRRPSKRLGTACAGALQQLPSLQRLRCSHNRLGSDGVPWEALRALTQLSHARLDHNQLRSMPERSLAGLTSLQLLNVSHNCLTSLPADIGELGRLRELSCSHNALAALPASLGAARETPDCVAEPHAPVAAFDVCVLIARCHPSPHCLRPCCCGEVRPFMFCGSRLLLWSGPHRRDPQRAAPIARRARQPGTAPQPDCRQQPPRRRRRPRRHLRALHRAAAAVCHQQSDLHAPTARDQGAGIVPSRLCDGVVTGGSGS